MPDQHTSELILHGLERLRIEDPSRLAQLLQKHDDVVTGLLGKDGWVRCPTTDDATLAQFDRALTHHNEANTPKVPTDQQHRDPEVAGMLPGGKLYTGPESGFADAYNRARLEHGSEVIDTLKSGPLATAGYLVDGERGANLGAVLDGVMSAAPVSGAATAHEVKADPTPHPTAPAPDPKYVEWKDVHVEGGHKLGETIDSNHFAHLPSGDGHEFRPTQTQWSEARDTHQHPDGVIISAGAYKDGGVFQAASISKATAFPQHIGATNGEALGWGAAVFHNHEIGIEGPSKVSEANRADFITAARDDLGQMWVILTDVKTKSSPNSSFPAAPDPAQIKDTWRAQLDHALERLHLGDPHLEAEIRAAAHDNKVALRQIDVDRSPNGQGAVLIPDFAHMAATGGNPAQPGTHANNPDPPHRDARVDHLAAAAKPEDGSKAPSSDDAKHHVKDQPKPEHNQNVDSAKPVESGQHSSHQQADAQPTPAPAVATAPAAGSGPTETAPAPSAGGKVAPVIPYSPETHHNHENGRHDGVAPHHDPHSPPDIHDATSPAAPVAHPSNDSRYVDQPPSKTSDDRHGAGGGEHHGGGGHGGGGRDAGGVPYHSEQPHGSGHGGQDGHASGASDGLSYSSDKPADGSGGTDVSSAHHAHGGGSVHIQHGHESANMAYSSQADHGSHPSHANHVDTHSVAHDATGAHGSGGSEHSSETTAAQATAAAAAAAAAAYQAHLAELAHMVQP